MATPPKDCTHCGDHRERNAKIELHEKKINLNCTEVKCLKTKVNELDIRFEYMEKAIDNMVAVHARAMLDMKKATNEKLKDMKDSVDEKLVDVVLVQRGIFVVIFLGVMVWIFKGINPA